MLAASFRMPCRVVIGFMSRDLLMSFATEVAATDLRFLSSTAKLHYAVWNGKTHIKDFRWIAVTPGASEQQGTATHPELYAFVQPDELS